MKKRKLDIAVISDVHLGTAGCHADELIAYLNSIQPNTLVLNGDIIDAWQEDKPYFPSSHLKVVKKIIGMAASGIEVYYITGNQDDNIRRLGTTEAGTLKIVNQLVLEPDGKKVWFFHGDVFDLSFPYLNWLFSFGNSGYHMLLFTNRAVNGVRKLLGWPTYALSKKIKERAAKNSRQGFNFEKRAVKSAIEKGYDYVVCGHIHQPKKAHHATKNGNITYLNSGDWVDNLTALEYALKRWKVYYYSNDKLSSFFADEDIKEMNIQELIATITAKKNLKEKGESID